MKRLIGKLLRPLVVVTTLLFLIMSPVCNDNNVSAQGKRHDVYPGDSIQQAIDDASPGDTIYVHDDNGNPYTYNENVDVNKPNLDLIGDDMDTVTVDAVDPGDHTFHLTENDITMTGFTITGSYTCGYGGICLEYADNCVISDNNCRENLCAGIFLKHSSNCEFINNSISNNGCGGIKIASDSDHNTVKGNIIVGNTNMGMSVYGSSEDNLIYNNYFDNPSKNTIDSVDWANTWNISKISGTNIIGGPYLGGNYFSDYTGEDNDGDGLGDTPYDIKNAGGNEVTNKDYLPLVEGDYPQLSYSPTSHDFGNMGEGETDSTTFEIWNSGSGTLTYSLSETCGWVSVNPTAGSSTGEHDTITVNIDTTGLTPGPYTCHISISSNDDGGTFAVMVNVIEELEPLLSYSPFSHDFGDMQEGQTDITTFEIWNSGTGTLTYSLSETCGWVSVNPTAGSSTGEHDTITVNIDTTGLNPDEYICSISISSNDDSGIFTVTVTVVEDEEPILSFTPHSHDFENMSEDQTNSTTFEIWNSGTGTLTYTLSENCNWISINHTSGSSTSEHDTITININTTGLTLGSHTCVISVRSNDGNTTFTVNATVVEGAILSFTPLTYGLKSMNVDHDLISIKVDQTDSTTFEIWNSGTGTLTYTLSEDCSWIDINPTNGNSTGERDTITMYVNTDGLKIGSYTCDISIYSTGGNDTFTITSNVLPESEETPGFEALIAIVGLLIGTTIIFLKKKRDEKQ